MRRRTHEGGALYGQCFTIIGRVVNVDTRMRNAATEAVADAATTLSKVHSKATVPRRNKIIATSRRNGMDHIIASTFHDSHASNRI